jgi:hypothetical protein
MPSLRSVGTSVAHRVSSYKPAVALTCRSPPCGRQISRRCNAMKRESQYAAHGCAGCVRARVKHVRPARRLGSFSAVKSASPAAVRAALVQASGIPFVGSTATRLEPTYDSGLGTASLRGLRRSDQAPWARIRRVLAALVQARGIPFVGSTATRLEPTYDSGLGMTSLRGLRRSDQAPWARIRRVLATLVQAPGIPFVGSTATRLEPTYDSGLGTASLRAFALCFCFGCLL